MGYSSCPRRCNLGFRLLHAIELGFCYKRQDLDNLPVLLDKNLSHTQGAHDSAKLFKSWCVQTRDTFRYNRSCAARVYQ